MFFSDDQEDYIFRPQLHLDSKWLNPDLQESFQDPDVLFELYNSLLLDREVYFSAGNGLVNSAGVTSRLGDSGKYYCGLRILTCTCCDGLCGPHSGCACAPCTELAEDEQLRLARHCRLAPRPAPSQVIDDLKWKQDPGPECLQSLLESLVWDQRMRAIKAVASNSYICQVRAFMAIYHRHLVAVIRYSNKLSEQNKNLLENKTAQESGSKLTLSSAVATLDKSSDVAGAAEDMPDHSESTLGLARVGARAALRLALSLVRRAWRCGEDADVCSALLRDALDAVRALPDAALYAGADVSTVPRSQKIWAEVVDSAAKFLHQVVNGELGCNVPIGDWRTSLCVWVELCARRAELPALLKAADMLLSLPQKQRRIEENNELGCNVPIGDWRTSLCVWVELCARRAELPALLKAADMLLSLPQKQRRIEENNELGCNVPIGDWRTSLCVWVELCARRAELPALLKAADMLLSLPQKQRRIEENKVVIEDCVAPLGPFLRRMGRVPAPRAPAGSEAYEGVADTNTDHTAEFLKSCELPAGDGLMAVRQAGIALMCYINRLAAPLLPPMKGFTTCTDSAQEVISVGNGHIPLGAVRVKQIACGERQALLLTQDGIVYTLPYETMSPQLVPGLENTPITQIACHGAGRHYLCLSGAGCVYSWGCGDDGRLGLGDTAPRDAATPVPGLQPHEAMVVIAGPATR
ncbi:unnamed protein product [Plutella xylostella]|uniref:(diamondback moth) hypothetical protein n=1 Tax=Plutella xylostella TaxID=51655 RepID=A0A8S4E507_PLUXY|nr:unnamed protein product [Plutella xylostella]